MAESDWKRLHPASVAVNLIPTAWRALRSLWPLLLALVVGGGAQLSSVVDMALLTVFFGTPIWRTVMHWITLRYRVHEGRLEITSGLLYRQDRVIPPERIQNVELVRNVFHRMSGLVELRVETASGTDIEGVLSALSQAEAEALMEAIDSARSLVRADPTEEAAAPLIENSALDLLRYGLSAARFSLVLVVIGVGYEFVLQSGTTEVASTARLLGLAGTGVALVGLLLGVWLFGTLAVMVRHWGYRLTRTQESIISEEGLFTRRRVELPIAKVQLVSVSESILRRWLGFGVLHIETAAAREGGGGTQRAEAVVPVVPTERRSELIRHALPEAPALEGLPLQPPHPLAVRRAMLGSAVRTGIVAGVLSAALFPAGLIAWILVPLALGAVWLDHYHQGWWIGPEHIVSRAGWILRKTRVVSRHKVQSMELVQGPIARRWGIGQLKLRVAGSAVLLPMQRFEEAFDLELELSESLPAVALGPSPRQGRVPLVDEDEARTDEQQPGGHLGHQAHQDQAVEEQQLTGPRAPSERDPADHGERPDRDSDQARDHEQIRQGAGPAVEPRLPHRIGASLHQHDPMLEGEQPSDGDMHGGDDVPDQ